MLDGTRTIGRETAATGASVTSASEYLLPTETRRVLHNLAHCMNNVDPATQPDAFVEQAHGAARRLPDRLIKCLRHFARFGSSTGTLLLRGLKTGPIPPTPPDNLAHLGERTLFAKQRPINGQSI